MIPLLKSQLASTPDVYKTPCFVYDASKVRENYRELKAALGTKLMLSIKANHCTDLLHLIGAEFDGFEVASEFELNILALFKSEMGFINNPSLTSDLMRKAVAAKVTITLDNAGQIDSLLPLKKRLKPVYLRLSAALFLDENQPLPKGMDHFGMDRSDLELALDRLKDEAIRVAGVHIFRGSNNFSSTAMNTLERLPAVLDSIEERLGYALETVNIGGGFDVDVLGGGFDFESYRKAIAILDRYQILHESGRGIFGSAGCFVVTVVAVKKINEQPVVVCDGGMAQSFLLAQTERTIKKLAVPVICPFDADARETVSHPAKIVGNSCNRDDVIGQLPVDSQLPKVGDKLIFENCGAYQRTYSPIDFLGLPKAQEYVLDH